MIVTNNYFHAPQCMTNVFFYPTMNKQKKRVKRTGGHQDLCYFDSAHHLNVNIITWYKYRSNRQIQTHYTSITFTNTIWH